VSRFNLSFDHLALVVKSVDESMAFYQKVFQLEEIPNTALESKTRWLALGTGKQLHLIPRPDFDIKINKANHFALATEDLSSFVTHLESLEIPYTDWKGVPNKIYVRNDGIRQVYFQDPNGHWVEVNDAV